MTAQSLLPPGTESAEETKAPEETDDDCGVAAAAADTANINIANTSRDLLRMPWVKHLPNHLIAALFQLMPPPLKRQVEMIPHRMANIMKVHGWRKWSDNIDITIPVTTHGSFRVNDLLVHEWSRDVVDCVQLMLSRICIRRFSLRHDYIPPYGFPDQKMVDVVNKVMEVLAKSKDAGVAITELRLDMSGFLLKFIAAEQVITAFSDSLTHISTPPFVCDAMKKCDRTTAAFDAISKCHHLETLVYGRGYPKRNRRLHENGLKSALAEKSSLTSLSCSTENPFRILVGGVYHIQHLAIEGLDDDNLQLGNNGPTAEQAHCVSQLQTLEIDYLYPIDTQKLLTVLQVAPMLERLHLLYMAGVSLDADDEDFEDENPDVEDEGGWVVGETATPAEVSSFVRDLADYCYRSRRSLTLSAWRTVTRFNVPQEFLADGGMLASMMKFDKDFATSPMLSHYGVMAFDQRLHEFDATLIPPTTELPPHITTVDGSRAYKRLFKINVRSGVHLSIGFEESEPF